MTIDGGIHISIDIRFDHEQIAKMPASVVTALMGGVASILTAHQYAVMATVPAAPSPTTPSAPAEDSKNA